MSGGRVCVLLVVGAVAAAHARPAGAACAAARASAAYRASVSRVVAASRDVWGGELLHAPGGPALEPALRMLGPLTRGMQWEGRPLTAGGVYYLPFSFPFTPRGSTVFALHVADGSQIFTRRVECPSLTVALGNGRAPEGSSTAEPRPPRLDDA